MLILTILFSIIASYSLLFFLFPKGNPIQEMIYLPFWWFKMYQVSSKNMVKTKWRYGNHFRQYLMVYEPKTSLPKKKNVIVYIHGGGWQFARPQGFEPNAQDWVNEGYLVIMPSLRRIPFFDIDDMREDLNSILKKTEEILLRKGRQDYKIILGGMSSGAHLVALLGLDSSNLKNINFDNDRISGLFLLGAPVNLNLMRPSPILYFLAGKRGLSKFTLANPIEYINEQTQIQVLGIHGTKDGLVEHKSAQSFYNKLNQFSPDLTEFHSLKNISHLETAGWSFMENGVRKLLFNWLAERET